MAEPIRAFFDGADLAGYHIGRFDVKVMSEEFHRAGMNFGCDERLIVDVQAIFHQKERRDLTAAYKFYCNKDLTGAHSADESQRTPSLSPRSIAHDASNHATLQISARRALTTTTASRGSPRRPPGRCP